MNIKQVYFPMKLRNLAIGFKLKNYDIIYLSCAFSYKKLDARIHTVELWGHFSI